MTIAKRAQALAALFLALVALSAPAGAQAPLAQQTDQTHARWYAQVEACDTDNRAACDEAVSLAAQLFERTDRNVAVTWMKACMAGDHDRCEIGYRRFRNTSFADDPQPISHMFARAACFGGMYDLCRPWDDFETTDREARAIVMAEVCMQGASPNTCYEALAYFRNHKGAFNVVRLDLSGTLCERYQSPTACRAYGEVLEARWDPVAAYRYHKFACDNGLQESCPDATRLKRRVDYEAAQRARAEQARIRREIEAQAARSYRSQLTQRGYTSSSPTLSVPTTPFGNNPRDWDNWNRYQRNLCLANPVRTRC